MMRPFVFLRLVAAAIAACAVSSAACSDVSRTPEIRFLVPPTAPDRASVSVVGIPSRYLAEAAEMSPTEWADVLRVTVSPTSAVDPYIEVDVPAVAGSYRVAGDVVSFSPMFGFDPGVWYRVQFDGSKLPAAHGWTPDLVVSVVGLPKKQMPPTTTVARVYPSADLVPENQLRLYVEFTAPMGRKGGLDYVHLLDDRGEEVKQAFLPLDAEFWNADRTRFTVFFDPGRVKRGIMPNEQMGRPLSSGRQYTLLVDRSWPDANGNPLKEDYRRTFRAGPADLRPLDPAAWSIRPPRAASRDPLLVVFPEPLDHGLLMRALGVSHQNQALTGDVTIGANETEWRFAPSEPWQAGDYQLIALTFLEDMAGNRIGRAFEVDEFREIDPKEDQERVALPFRISK